MKKLIIIAGFLVLSGIITAQNTSYDANTLSIAGNNNVALGFGTLTTGFDNVGVGKNALQNNTLSGLGNVAVGWQAMQNNTNGFYNTASGANALLQNIGGYYNTATGSAAMENNTYGYFNTATGLHALWTNTTGNQNTSHGMQSSFSNTTGSNNVAAGYQSLYSNSVGNFNVADGYHSLYNNTVDNNVATGAFSLFSNTTGVDNTGVGYEVLFSNSFGSQNTAMGNGAGYTANGQSNAYFGYKAGFTAGPGNNNTFLGSEAGANGIPGADENVLVGWRAGFNIGGLHNVCIGNNSGFNNTGYQNTFVGIGSGINCSGQNNVALGGAASLNPTINFASAIGAGSIAMVSNTMILGDNSINVGIGLSGNILGPGNKLEISTGTNGSSGLRFRNLTSTNTPVANPGTGVLALSPTGDVIYVNSSSSSSLGNACPASTNPLTTSWNIPLNGNDFYFSDDNPQTDKVHVGYTCTPGIGKFNVATAVESNPSNQWESYSIHGINTFNTLAGAATFGTGVYGEATALLGSTFEKGVWGRASGTRDAIGVMGEAVNSIGNAYGGYFSSVTPGGLSTNFGIYTEATGGAFNYGIYSTVFGATSGGGGPDWAGFFDGDLVGTAYIGPSDRNLKKDIIQIENSLDIINRLNPVTYHFDTENHQDIGLNDRLQYGFISQEVKEILPDLTSKIVYPAMYDSKGNETRKQQEYLGLNYDGFIAILAKGIQDQQKQIDELKEMVQSLVTTGNSINAQNVTLSDKNTIVLNQNVPNPFAESTVISYNIPGNFGRAQMIFSTIQGEIIKLVDITSAGEGRLSVFADDLTTGVYTYSLVVDGKTIDTKKMIKQ